MFCSHNLSIHFKWCDMETKLNKAQRRFVAIVTNTKRTFEKALQKMDEVIASVEKTDLKSEVEQELQVAKKRQQWLHAVLKGSANQLVSLKEATRKSNATSQGRVAETSSSRDLEALSLCGPSRNLEALETMECYSAHKVKLRGCTTSEEVEAVMQEKDEVKDAFQALLQSCRTASADLTSAYASRLRMREDQAKRSSARDKKRSAVDQLADKKRRVQDRAAKKMKLTSNNNLEMMNSLADMVEPVPVYTKEINVAVQQTHQDDPFIISSSPVRQCPKEVKAVKPLAEGQPSGSGGVEVQVDFEEALKKFGARFSLHSLRISEGRAQQRLVDDKSFFGREEAHAFIAFAAAVVDARGV